jgi:hypothetical protein
MGQTGIVGVESQRDERLEATCLILQLTEPNEVIDPMMGLFDVSVEHRRIGPQTEFVCLTVDAEPIFRCGFIFANLGADFGMEDLGSTSGKAS